MRPSPRSAFSLVELAVVLAVIGLIAGGVMVGQSLTNGARVNSVGTGLTQYDNAMQQFRDRFRAWPGDMLNATNYWGIAAGSTGNDVTCQAAATTNGTTCNGNGDGKMIEYEIFRTWQHLANAGLITGSYNGVTGGSTTFHNVPGVNAPTGPMKSSGYSTYSYVPAQSNFLNTDMAGNLLFFGAPGTGLTNGAILSSAEAQSMDLKIDDGKPGTGQVQQYNPSARPNCATNSTSAALYDVRSKTARVCGAIFRLSNQAQVN